MNLRGLAAVNQLVAQPVTSTQLNSQIQPVVSQALVGTDIPSVLTVNNLAQPLPDITGALAPLPVSCSQWSKLNALIAEYPLASFLILTGVFVVLYPKGKR